MGNIKLSDQELQKIHEQYINDPRRQELLNSKANIVSMAIPEYIINSETKVITTVYDEKTQRALDKIDELLNSLYEEYSQKLKQ